ncbi:hypothetical protein [Vibrio tritonius]|uniref:hypothetical protein n=1 Tax=Vibrio tritonius TaxID=1435069 RepID=UPI00315D7197
MSSLRKIGPNHWTAPEIMGFIPNFHQTENARRNYPFGHFLKEEPLQPNNKIINLKYDDKDKDLEGLGEFFQHFSAGGHKNFLDMRLYSINARGGWIYLAMFWGGLYAIIMYLLRTLSPHYKPGDFFWFDVAIISFLGIGIIIDLFRPLPTPVRFHKKNQEVYIWHKRVLYRIPWNECEISVVVAQSNIGYGHLWDGYDLVIWLNPKHAVNKDLSGKKHRRLKLDSVGKKHVAAYGYWEYVRRYMMDEKPLWYEISERPRVAGFNHKIINTRSKLHRTLVYILGVPCIFLFKPHQFSLWFNPFRHKWPDQVHEWSGERCNWL